MGQDIIISGREPCFLQFAQKHKYTEHAFKMHVIDVLILSAFRV